jgi:hypothetical protein
MGGGTGSHPPPELPAEVNESVIEEDLEPTPDATAPSSKWSEADFREPSHAYLYGIVIFAVAGVLGYLALVAVYGYGY